MQRESPAGAVVESQEGCGSSPGRGWSQRLQGGWRQAVGASPLWAQVPLGDQLPDNCTRGSQVVSAAGPASALKTCRLFWKAHPISHVVMLQAWSACWPGPHAA